MKKNPQQRFRRRVDLAITTGRSARRREAPRRDLRLRARSARMKQWLRVVQRREREAGYYNRQHNRRVREWLRGLFSRLFRRADRPVAAQVSRPRGVPACSPRTCPRERAPGYVHCPEHRGQALALTRRRSARKARRAHLQQIRRKAR